MTDVEQAIERARNEGSMPRTGQGTRAMIDRRVLAAEVKRLQAELAETMGCFDEANEGLVGYMEEVARLQAIIDKLPTCWRLVGTGDGRKLVQDASRLPNDPVWDIRGRERIVLWNPPVAPWPGYSAGIGISSAPIPVSDCYDSPKAAEFAAEAAKGATDG